MTKQLIKQQKKLQQEHEQDDWTDPVGVGEDDVIRYILVGICFVAAIGVVVVLFKMLETIGLF